MPVVDNDGEALVATHKARIIHLFTEHPAWNLIDIYAAAIPDFPISAGVHVHYQEAVLRIRDGMPKMKDLPTEMGGSGTTVAE